MADTQQDATKTIADIAQRAKECVHGVARVPVDHLFHTSIAETREFSISEPVDMNVKLESSAVVSRDVSEPDIDRLLDSMYGRLYRDFDGDEHTGIHVLLHQQLISLFTACIPLAVVKSALGMNVGQLPKDLTEATFESTPILHFINTQGAGSVLLLGGQVCFFVSPPLAEGELMWINSIVVTRTRQVESTSNSFRLMQMKS
jgi:hypothetical protein